MYQSPHIPMWMYFISLVLYPMISRQSMQAKMIQIGMQLQTPAIFDVDPLKYGVNVDNTLLLFNDTYRQIESMVADLNERHSKIRLTLELEKDKLINLLDVTVMKKDESLHYSEHTQIYNYKHNHLYSFFYPHSHKMSKKKIDIIKQIPVINDYSSSIIDKLLCKHHEKSFLPWLPKEGKTYIKYYYKNLFALFMDTFLKKSSTSVAFFTSNSVLGLPKPFTNSPVRKNESLTWKLWFM